jgi:hypothetical protein
MRTNTGLAALSVGILLVAGAAYWLPSERGQSVAPQTPTSSVRNVPAEVTTPASSAAKPPALCEHLAFQRVVRVAGEAPSG